MGVAVARYYLVLAGAAASVAGFAAGASAVFSVFALVVLALAVCFAVLCLATCSAFGAAGVAGVAVAAAGAVLAAGAAGAAGAPVWANTGRAKAENRVATMMEVDFMAIFLKEKFSISAPGSFVYCCALLPLTSLKPIRRRQSVSKDAIFVSDCCNSLTPVNVPAGALSRTASHVSRTDRPARSRSDRGR